MNRCFSSEQARTTTDYPVVAFHAAGIVSVGVRGEDYHTFPSHEEKVQEEAEPRRRSVKKSKTPTFLLELPLVVDAGQAKRLRAHFEAARCLYNALLGEALKRLRQMRVDPAWQEARAIPQAQKQERTEARTHRSILPLTASVWVLGVCPA